MKKIFYKLIVILILVFIWLVLNASFTWESFATGFVFASISLYLSHRLFFENDNIHSYYMPLWFFIFYLFAMLYFIAKASVLLIINLLKGKKNPKVVTINTRLNNAWYTSIVANSITLTPGTVTLDKTDDTMEVLWYCADDEDAAYEHIAWQFERLFKRIDKRG